MTSRWFLILQLSQWCTVQWTSANKVTAELAWCVRSLWSFLPSEESAASSFSVKANTWLITQSRVLLQHVSASRTIPQVLRNPTIHYRFHKTNINPRHLSQPIYCGFTLIYLPFTYVFQAVSFLQVLWPKPCLLFSRAPYAPHARQFHRPWCQFQNNIWREV